VVEILGVHYPPYEIENPTDNRRGHDLEVIEAAFANVGIKANFTFLPWNRAVMIVKKGDATALMSCSYRPERDEFYQFSDVISLSTRGFYGLANYDGPIIKKLEDVKKPEFSNISFGIVQGYALEQILKNMGVAYDSAPNDALGLKKIFAGRTDLFLTTKENTEYLLREMGEARKLQFFRLFDAKYHVCFSKKAPNVEHLLAEFNKGLRMLQYSGRYEEIHANYR